MTIKSTIVMSIGSGIGFFLGRLLLNVWSGQSLAEDMPLTLLITASGMISPFLVYYALRLTK
jgi:hypothetical protein